MLVALVSVEKHKHALISQVALTETVLVQAVDLGVGQHVTYALQVDYHHVTLGQLPREVTQTLGNQALVGIFSSGISPTSVVIVLVVLALDEVFSIVVFEGSVSIQYLIDEGVNKLNHVAGVHQADQLIVEIVNYVLTNEHSLDVVLHFLRIVSDRVHILRNFDNILLFEVLIHHHESIAHGTFCKRILSYLDE